MATEPHKSWPRVGSVWQHWSDLLLATQLAALRAGFNYVGRSWCDKWPQRLGMRCEVGEAQRRVASCYDELLVAAAHDPNDLTGAWRVSKLFPSRLKARQHLAHASHGGISKRLKQKPASRAELRAGDILSSVRELHTLEGSLRSEARRDGRFLSIRQLKRQGDRPLDFVYRCVLPSSLCAFLVKFSTLESGEGGGSRWMCVEIRSQHTCVSAAGLPDEQLKKRLDFFPPVRLNDGAVGRPTRVHKPNDGGVVSLRDQRLGAYPVTARIQPVRPPSPELLDPAYRSPCPSPPPLAAFERNKPKPPAPARTPPPPTSSRSPSPAPARAPTPAREPSPSPSPAPAAPVPAAAPPPPPSHTPSALLARRSASLASATAVLAALEQAIEVQRALVAKKQRSVERAAGKLEVRRKEKMQEVVKQVFKKPGPPRRSRAERRRLKQQREREARERREAQ